MQRSLETGLTDCLRVERRRILRRLGGGGLQMALDAETLLDESPDDIPLFGWDDEQLAAAEWLRDEYRRSLEGHHRVTNSDNGQELWDSVLVLEPEEIWDDVVAMLADLDEEDLTVFRFLFVVEKGQRLSYDDVARHMNLPVEEIRRREAEILARLHVDSGAHYLPATEPTYDILYT